MARKLENWFKSYLEYTEFLEAPYEFHFWTGVSVIAGAVRQKVWFDQFYYKWTPNFYIIFVAPSGEATKSTAINTGMGLLRELPNIKFGPDKLTAAALEVAFSEATERFASDPSDPLGLNSLTDSVSCLTFAISELGTYLNARDDSFLSLLTDLWDGKGLLYTKTKGAGDIKVPKPWINFIAGTTPTWIAENTGRLFALGGLAGRSVFIYRSKKRRLSSYPLRTIQKAGRSLAEMEKLKQALIHDLSEIAAVQGAFTLTEEAYVWGDEWYTKIHEKPPEFLFAEDFGGYRSRKQCHAHKIAMIYSLAKSNKLVITLEDLQASVALLEEVEAEMHKVFDLVGTTPEKDQANYLLAILRTAGKPMPRGLLFQHMFNKYTIKATEFSELLGASADANLLRIEQVGTSVIVRLVEEEAQVQSPPDEEEHPQSE